MRGLKGGISNSRSSNLELARIIAMLAIIAHHYVVNSGVTDFLYGYDLTGKGVFLQLWGMWGKTAINVFVLITGYFMCEKEFKWRRLIRLVLQVEFWKIMLFPVFFIVDVPAADVRRSVLSIAFLPLLNVNNSFTSSFIVFYLFIPALKFIVDRGGAYLHAGTMALLFASNTVSFSFFSNSFGFTEVSWYAFLFLLAAWLRRHPPRFISNPKTCFLLFSGCVALSVGGTLFLDAQAGFGVGAYGTGLRYLDQSGKIMAFLVGLTCFLFFRVLPVKQSPLVNVVASTTFGVLLVHANSAAMRKFLWRDVLNVPRAFSLPGPLLVLHAVASMIGVFTVSSVLDWLRIRYVEPVYMGWYDRHARRLNRLAERMASKAAAGLSRLDSFLAGVDAG